MSEMPVVSQIQHYQKSIQKSSENESRVLHCIQKLYRLPVTVQHLQETGVGRTVNGLRKFDGTVGDAAKALVAKWKTMVADEESSECDDEDETCLPDVPEGYSDNSDSGMDRDTSHQGSSKRTSHESYNQSSRSSSKHDTSRHSSKQSSSTTNSQAKLSVTQAVPESSTDQNKHTKSSSEKSELRSNHNSKHDSRSEKKSKSSRDSKSDRHDLKKHELHNSTSKNNKVDGVKGESYNRVSSTTGTNKEVNGNDGHRKRKREVSLSDKSIHKRRRSLTTIGDSDDIENDVENKFLPDTSVQSDIECDVRIKVKSEPSDSPSINNRASTSKDTTKKEKSSKDKHRDSNNKLKDDKHKHSSDKHKSKSESKSDHRRSEKKNDSHSSTKSCANSNSRNSKDRDEFKNSSEKIKEKSSSESKDKSKSQEHKDKKKKKSKYNELDGIDCNSDTGASLDLNCIYVFSGTSFAEALGMCMTPVNKKKMPSSPSLSVTKSIKIEPGSSSSSSSLASPAKPIKVKTEISSPNDQPLSLLAPNVKLEPLTVDLASTLPEISPHYKPLPVNYMNPIHRRQEEDKALNEAIYAKNMRTKVYSGNKTSYTSVPSLYELCIRVLIENIEALEATGGVPYYIIKPVLERATADQLFMIEHYNPYVIEDTDELWKFHCNREFRTKQREEMESWREMYMRCLDEREAKLKTLTANIKQSIDKSLPARSTKMAYVDNIVKPPRNVLRKQAKYGTSNTATSSSDLKKKILTGGTNAPTNIAVPPPPLARMKTSTAVMKKNKAPLMAKALQLIKGRYKR